MAANAIGKISFQVVADTSRVDRNLGESAKSFQRYATAINKTISGASAGAAKQFNAILTPLQRLNEALNQGTGRLQFRGLEQSRQQIEQLALASREVAKPLADVAKSFDSLSLGVQGAFIPALKSAQDEVRSLEASITGGRGAAELSQQFERASASVEKTSAAVSRLRSLSSLTESLQTGNEANFTSPRLVEQLRRSSQLQSATSSLPAGTIESDRTIRSFTIAIKEASNEALVLSANLERAVLAGSDTSQIEASLARVVNRQREYNDALERQISGNSSQQARAQFASQFLQVDQRESDLIANQGLATDVSERIRLIAQVQRREREFAEAREDAARRAQAASRLLVVDQLGSEIASNQGARTDLQPGTLQRSAERTAAQQVGAGVDTTIRQLDQLAQRVQGVRGQIDSLPATIGTGFIPQLQRAEQEFIRLRSSGRATAEEIENASNSVEQLAAQVRRVGAAQSLGSFADGLNDTALRGAIGNLQALQQILNRVGATAGSEAANQFDRMRAAIQRATREGTIGSEAFQRELRQLSQEAANAAAATGRIGRAAAFREIQRGGDIARGGFDKLSLATQQAAFAIDDFFSATGDFTQKIRAVQNNVTQLAFILGGTTGLFIGLGVAIAAQAAVALFKWSQGTVDAEDKTQALNDALARQKNLVEDLRQAFESLGDAVSRGLLDPDASRLKEISDLADDVRRKSQESSVERIASLDPIVQQQQAARVGLERQLGEETDTAARIRLQREIELTRRREDRRVQSIREREPVTQDEATQRVLDGFDRILEGRLADLRGVSDAQLQRTRDAAGVDLQGLRQRLEGIGSAEDAIDAIDERISELSRQRGNLPDLFGLRKEGKAIDDEIVELTKTIAELERTIDDGAASLRAELLESTGEVRDSLVRSGRIINDSLGGFGPIAQIQRNLAERLSLIQSELSSGRVAGADGRVTADDRALTQDEIEQRKALRDRLSAEALQLEATTRSAEALEQAFRRLADQLAETVRQEAAADVERTRRAANAAEARGGVGIDDFRRAAEREFAQGPQPEPLVDLEPLRTQVKEAEDAAFREAARVDADLDSDFRKRKKAAEEANARINAAANDLVGIDLSDIDARLKAAGDQDVALDASLAASSELATRSSEDVRRALVDAGADEAAVDAAIADRLKFQEDEQKWWAARGARYIEETRSLKAGQAALEKAFSTDEERVRFVAALRELRGGFDLGIEGEAQKYKELSRQFLDRLSGEEVASLLTNAVNRDQVSEAGSRLKAVLDEYRIEGGADELKKLLSEGAADITESLLNATQKQITDSLAPGQLTPGSIAAILDETRLRTTPSGSDVQAAGELSIARDLRESGKLDTAGFVLQDFQNQPAANLVDGIERLTELGRQLQASADELESAEFSNERSRELSSEIESIKAAIEGFDGSLESRRAIAEAADGSRFDEIQTAADIFLQKVRDLNLDRATAVFEEQIALDGQARIEELDRQRQAFQTQAQEDFQNAARRGQDPAGIADLVKQRDQLLAVQNRTADQETQLRSVTDGIQKAFEQSDAGVRASVLADEIDIERQRQVQAREQRESVRASATRGQDLIVTEEEKLRRRAESQFEDAQNAVLRSLIEPLREADGVGVAQEIEDGILSLQELATIFKRSPELKDQLDRELQGAIENLQVARNNITGNIAAQIAQFDAERARPSRAALQAQDVNTQQGRAELNRLLRGDDANRDQPVLQGIKEQTAVLRGIDRRFQDVKDLIGVAGA